MRAVHAVVPAGVDDPRRPSGGNSYDRQVLRGLAARGWEVHERSVTGPWPEADPAAQGRLAGVLDDIGDGAVVLVDGLVASLSDRALVAAARRLRVVPLVHLPVGPDPREGRVLDAAAVVVATSRHTREWLLEHYALEPHRVGVAAPGTGAAPLGSGSVGGGSVGGGRLLSVGAVTPVKGHDVLVEALALLGEVSWTCRIVGSLEVDPAHAATVTAAYVQQGMAPRFTWTGALPRRAMTGEYAAADLVVVPSRHESYGMVAAEALAAGVPVVASDVGGLREALSTGPDACLFVPPDEPEALAAALCAWLTDPPLRQRMRAAARAARVKRRDWGRTVADLEELLLAAGGRS